MIHNAEITLEKFKEGITLHWTDTENIIEPTKVLAVNGEEEQCIGKEVLSDVLDVLDESEKIKLIIEYIPIKD